MKASFSELAFVVIGLASGMPARIISRGGLSSRPMAIGPIVNPLGLLLAVGCSI
jgi:hypothetical protein